MKTKVKFLYHEEETENSFPDIFAFFPEEKNNLDPNFRLSYSKIGQHSDCHIMYAEESRPASREEYTPLLKELKEIGYEIEILN